MRHGTDCVKVRHLVGVCYTHAPEDDSPYDVDRVSYCGRCHAWIELPDRVLGEVSMQENVYAEIRDERKAQDIEWGGPEHDDMHCATDWKKYIQRHTDMAFGDAYRKQMIRVAALAVAAIQSYDRKARGERGPSSQRRKA